MDIRKLCRGVVGASVLAFLGVTGGPVQAEPLTIGAAHSLKASFKEILPLFEKEYGTKIHVVYGPSRTLRRQIEKGAQIDVFFSDAIEEVERLKSKGFTLNKGPQVYAQTSLVLIMSEDSGERSVSLGEALPDRTARLALVDPKTSAMGAISARALVRLDPAFNTRFHLLHAKNSEELVNLVKSGKADAGIVFRVDAINSGQVRIIDEPIHTPVWFGNAVVWTCREETRSIAEKFLEFVSSVRIQKLLLQYGFEPVSSNA